MVNINEQKAINFYSEVISLYPPEVIDRRLWGDKTEFLNSLRSSLYEGDNKEYKVDFSELKVKFSKPIFDILFLNDTPVEFNKPIGQRLELKNYIYLELKESPLANLNRKEDSRLFPLSKRRYYWGFFFINEDNKEDLYYPKEVLPIFIFQLRARLVKDYFSYMDIPSDKYINFCALFKPMKYILKVKKDKKALQKKILYRLCTDLGLIEHRTHSASKIDISQKIDNIYDKNADCETESPLLLSARTQYNLDSLSFYLSVMENLNPIYQFLELYHALESYFYKYFYNYIKDLKGVKTREEFKQIKDHVQERKMLELVIQDISNEFPQIRQKIDNIDNIAQFCENLLPKHVNLDNLDENNTDKFSNKLSEFIYLIRNSIVHTKEANKSIIDLSRSDQSTLIEINKLLLFIVQKVFDKNIKW